MTVMRTGQLLDRTLAEGCIDRSCAYVTNAVKHFKWESRGKRRIHGKPNAGEVRACRPRLEAEIALIAPRTIVAWVPWAPSHISGSGG